MNETERSILHWFGDFWIGPAIMRIPWMFPTLETLHFIGVCVLFGSLLLVDLRLLGFLRGFRPASSFTFLWLTVGAFLVLLTTGLGFFFTNPYNYWSNPVFRIKVVLIILGGLNALIFTFAEHRKLVAAGPDYETDTFTRWAAGLSLGMWTLVLFAGRSLPLFDTGQG
jgi:hypothetical protein